MLRPESFCCCFGSKQCRCLLESVRHRPYVGNHLHRKQTAAAMPMHVVMYVVLLTGFLAETSSLMSIVLYGLVIADILSPEGVCNLRDM